MKWLTGVALLLVVSASVVGWVTAGDTGRTSRAELRATAAALGQAAEHADATVALSIALQQSVDTLATGMGSAAEAMDHTVEVSKTVRQLLDSVSTTGEALFTNADQLHSDLQNAEASLLEVQGGMNETQADLDALGPALTKAVASLQALPAQLRAAQATVAATINDTDRQVLMWRVTLVMGAIAVLLLVVVVGRVPESTQP
jgi:septal ring factor EnvC (AmiA/AmiB activator)